MAASENHHRLDRPMSVATGAMFSMMDGPPPPPPAVPPPAGGEVLQRISRRAEVANVSGCIVAAPYDGWRPGTLTASPPP